MKGKMLKRLNNIIAKIFLITFIIVGACQGACQGGASPKMDILTIQKMSESQTKAGNQRKFENLKF